VFEFNKAIIDATKDLCVAYKINTAFYEAAGIKGWEAMENTVSYIGNDHLKIADAKRGDIGNTSSEYARAFFETLPFDAITVTPYMGEDSIRPFLEYQDKWTIVLGLTSNLGARDFELQSFIETTDLLKEGIHIRKEDTKFLYETVLEKASGWGTPDNLMFVVGATQAHEFENIRKITPHHFYLVPGVGAQGGSLKEISEKALIKDCGLLVNVSRAIIYASGKNDQ
jgi:orotidine-5'-phosphate decarboxylase